MNEQRTFGDGCGWLVLAPLGLTLMVFWPLPGTYFFGDDLLLLYDLANKPLVEMLLEPYGGHVFTTRNVVTLVLYRLVGPMPAVYFTLVLLTHLANVALLFVVIRGWMSSARLACFGAALWGAAPIHGGSLAWFQVYGQVLVATGLLVVLWRLDRVRRYGAPSSGELMLWGALLIGISTSQGLGIPVTLVLPVVAFLLLSPGPARVHIVLALAAVAVGVVVLYLGIYRVATALHPGQAEMPRVLDAYWYWQEMLDLTWGMLVFGLGSLLLGPVARLLPFDAIAPTVLVGLAAIPASRTRDGRARALAWVLLAVACYATTSAGRLMFYVQSRDSLIQAVRYHYAALVPLTLLVCTVLAPFGEWRGARRAGEIALAVWFLLFAVVQATAGPPFDRHAEQRQLADSAIATLRRLVTSIPAGEPAYIENRPFFGVGPFVISNPANFPGWAALFVVYSRSDTIDGHPVFFVEANADVRAKARAGRRAATLLVAPDEVPSGQVLRP